MIDWRMVPVFGSPDSRFPHLVRRSAYALIVGQSDRLAIVHTSKGSYLPGGGMMDFESPEAAICREAREECGLAIVPRSWRRVAIDHIISASEATHFEKRSTFCDATVRGPAVGPCEPDHRLAWMSAEDALRVLTPPSHRWAVAEWLAGGRA
jgi:8-oxo-dGTP diphosphatase